MYSEEFVLCLYSLYCDGDVSLSSLVRVANEIGLAGLHRAKLLCLVSLGETAVAPPSEVLEKYKDGRRVSSVEEGKERTRGEEKVSVF